jgi:hypothetical protein
MYNIKKLMQKLLLQIEYRYKSFIGKN